MAEMSEQRMRWVPFGTIGRPHGLRGELRLVPFDGIGDLPESVETVDVLLGDGTQRELTLASARWANNAWLVMLDGIADRDEAARLTGAELRIAESDLPALAAGEFYYYELPGVAVHSEAGEALGTVIRTEGAGPQDLLVVNTPKGERLLPMVDTVVLKFDRQEQTLTVRVPPGLWELDEA